MYGKSIINLLSILHLIKHNNTFLSSFSFDIRYKTNPTKFAQTVKSWGAKTIAELSNDYDDEALKLVDISPADYKKAHDELFGQNVIFLFFFFFLLFFFSFSFSFEFKSILQFL